MNTPTEPVRLRKSQIKEAGEVLARAFQNDPLTVWFLPDEEGRRRALRWFYPSAIRYGHLFGEVYSTAERVEAAAIWLPPGDTKVTLSRMFRVGTLMGPLKFGLAGFLRFMAQANHFGKLQARDLKSPHWYLMELGVDPACQGRGVGSAVIKPVLDRADVERSPCYLETQNERNLPFYDRHGFEVVVQGDLPSGGPKYWTMKREPRDSHD